MRNTFLLFLLAVLLSPACRKELKNMPEPPVNDADAIIALENERFAAVVTQQTVPTYVSGWVVNEQNQPIADALVSCAGKTITSDAKGYFNFKNALAVNRDYALITIKKSGYADAFKTFTPSRGNSNHAEKIRLLSPGNTQTVSNASGGDILISNAVKLSFPVNAVENKNGAPYTGNYTVTGRYLDPAVSGNPDQVPGMLAGLNISGTIQAIQSLGMASVEIRDNAGNELQIAAGSKVKMELPAAASAPATLTLWHFNEKYGLWIQAGQAQKNGNYYIAEVNHFSIWNIGAGLNNFRLNLRFVNGAQAPLSALKVWVYLQSTGGFAGSYFTDNNGEATLIHCPSATGLILKTILDCDTLTQTLAPVTQDRDETVVFNSAGANGTLFNFNGTLFDCNNNFLPNQAFQILLSTASSGATILGVTDAQGQFTSGTILCNPVNNVQAQTAAFYNNAFRYSVLTPVNPGTNSYNPVVCDTIIPGPGFQDNQVVTFTDPNLELKVREAINKLTGTLFYLDVKFLTQLTASGANIQILGGIQYCTALTTLDLGSNLIADLSPLQTLSSLRDLNLYGNNFSNISPLQNLTGLTKLNIGRNPIASFTPIQSLVNLDLLGLNQTGLANLGFLQGLTNLRTVFAATNQISDLTPLQSLTGLTNLNLWENQITSIAPLQQLVNLTKLEIWRNQVTDISPLQSLTSLTILAAGKNRITNIQPLQNLVQLTNLSLDSNQLSSVAALQNLTSLTYLALDKNFISDITPLQNLTALTQLNLSQNQLTQIGALSNMTLIANLWLTDNLITDITPLQHITGLRMLYLRNNRIGNNLAPLAGLSELRTLGLSVNLISSIQPILNAFPNLTMFGIITGNTVPAGEISTFRANHPGCIVN